MIELSLAVVGIDFPNEDKSNRRFELLQCRSGEPVELRLEPKNKKDRNAIAVFSVRGMQVGYLTAERAVFIGARIGNGESFEAVFQDLDVTAAYIRVRFGGGAPTLPPSRADGDAGQPVESQRDRDFYPDEDGPEWGA